MLASLREEDGDTIASMVVGNPTKFSAESEAPATYPPRLGAEARDVLRAWLDMAPLDIQALSDRDALMAGVAPPARGADIR